MRFALFALFLAAAAPDPRAAALSTTLAAQPQPLAVYVTGDGADYGAAAGAADPTSGRALTTETPMRIASNTKTFVAVAVLRLWEEGRIALDAPIAPLIAPALDATLRRDGYDTGAITVRHLLSHSGGLYDHGSDARYEAAMHADPHHRWTREALIALMAEYGDPLAKPGAAFHYSDDDYILLGDIVERITGKTLAAAVRELDGLDRLGLNATYWEVYERPRPSAVARARQFIGEDDVTGVDASFDLYGGGGIVSTPKDLARFFKALFEGRVFERPRTLEVMLTEGPQKDGDKYRFGIFVTHTPHGDFYWHSGFWGTWAGYSPETGIAVAGMTTRQQGFRAMIPIVRAVVMKER